MATDYSSLIPKGVARDVISAAVEQSAVLTLGRTITMPEGAMSVPIITVAPSASFVGAGARKPVSMVEWTAEALEPEEIALTTWIPDVYIDDAGFPLWESVRAEASAAIARALDAAVLYGTGAPASYPSGGLAAIAGTAQTGTDALAAIDAAASSIEATGLIPNGIAAGTAIGSALRKAYREIAMPPSEAPTETIYGMQVVRTSAWDSTKGDAIVGDWTKLLVGVREDVRFELSDSATLTDGAGVVVVSAFEQDVTAARIFMRVAIAVAQPVQPDGSGTVVPFEFADWTA